jgi:hypothetical protein
VGQVYVMMTARVLRHVGETSGETSEGGHLEVIDEVLEQHKLGSGVYS